MDSKIEELAVRMIQVQFEERRKELLYEVMKAHEWFNSHGTYHSSMHIQKIIELCSHEIEVRARLVLQVYLKILSQLGKPMTDQIGQDLKKKIDYYVPVRSDYSEHIEALPKLLSRQDISLAEARSHAFKKVGAEIDLLVLSFENRTKENEEKDTRTVVNIYGQVGAFQTGPGATANVVQNIGVQDREALLEALRLVRQTLQQEKARPDFNKDEVMELVEDAQVEVEKPKPNGIKLTSILTTIGNSIQTIVSFERAYQALKTALLPFGIFLS